MSKPKKSQAGHKSVDKNSSVLDKTVKPSNVGGSLTSPETDTQKWLDSVETILEYVLKSTDPQKAPFLFDRLNKRLRESGVKIPETCTTPYLNSISPEDEVPFPGDREIERRIKSIVRWNALAMVVKANREKPGIGGHISTYASCATLYEVGYNHFFRGRTKDHPGDFVYFQGHASPGNYARAYVERRMDAKKLHNFRQELAEGGGLSSYPHPYLMPDYWQFPSVSMGLAPITSIYQARFNRYMMARGLVSYTRENEPNIFCFVGDGETGEPETLGQLSIAAQEGLDNLIWTVNCNLQRLDGPVRGNGKIIQELEGVFKGAGWNVIKVIWGSDWDEILRRDKKGLLLKRMEEAVDGEYQKYSVESGAYVRKHFFGKYPELLELVNHLSDERLNKLMRGGHDPQKVYAAYKAAVEHKGSPTVILAKTIKGYGLGEAGEGRNITHQQKKLNEKEMREFRKRFDVPLDEDEVVTAPFYRPAEDSKEAKYIKERRAALGGHVPGRTVSDQKLKVPSLDFFKDFFKESGKLQASSTMAFVRILGILLRNPDVGKHIVPIIPDEARTFGMDALFRQIGIYSHKGQLYDPVDKESLLYYQEAKDGQILEEGINEAGSMASFIAAGTSHATNGTPMIPMYIYYSMFGPQRVGDLFWLCGDIRARGFLLGGTSGRTTLNGEGLQHQDGHSHLFASTIPSLIAYDPAFAYELAIIMQDGLRRMYQENEDIFYYLSVYNENHAMPAKPEGCEEGVLKGLYPFQRSEKKAKNKVHLFGSGPIIFQALKAKEVLEEKYDIAVDVWSATSYNQLRRDALNCKRWNMLHPDEEPKKSYLETVLEKEEGVFVSVSDNMKIVADQIAAWVPGGLTTLGTDGFGRSETRENLRRFFEIDSECVVIAALYALAEKGEIDRSEISKAIKELKVDPEKVFPIIV